MKSSPVKSRLKWAGVAVGALVLAVIVAATALDWNALRGPIARYASARLGRPVSVGSLRIQVWSLTPRVEISDLTIGAPAWDEPQPSAKVQRLGANVKLLPLLVGRLALTRVGIEHASVYLHRDPSGRINWASPDRQRQKNVPLRLPVVGQFLVEGGELKIVDEIRKLHFQGTVDARESAATPAADALRIEGRGELNARPFSLQITGGPLLNLDRAKPYPFKVHMTAADSQVEVNGEIPQPFDFGSFQLAFRATGEDLADLYYLTGLALPNTARYDLAASIERDGGDIKVTQIAGTIGGSDIHGELNVQIGGARRKVSGSLKSKTLDIRDLAEPLGARIARRPAASPALHPRGLASNAETAYPPFFPTARLQLNRVRGMDADVHYGADTMNAGSLPMKKVAIHVLLNDGIMRIAPFSADLPQGTLSGTSRTDARGQVPHTDVDLRLTNANLDQFKSRAPGSEPPLAGALHMYAKVQGPGASLHELAAHASGSMTAVIPHGTMRKSFAELTGINVTRALGLLIRKDTDRTDIRCGVANFRIEDGVMHAQNFVFDTTDVLVLGRGEVRLGTEEWDLSLQGEPKKLRLVRLRAPIEIEGHFRKPVVRIDIGKSARQAGIAAALGAVIAPLAAVIAFVDPGLAKDADCAHLFTEAQGDDASGGAKPPRPTP